MLSVLRDLTYRRLFMAQAIALLGTGLLTIALGLLAFDLAADRAGAVLGTAYAIKMVAYVGLSPLASALFSQFKRKHVLIGADLVRIATALFLPFITSVWQIYVLIFVLQAASASFTPVFQATIPDVLPKEEEYTKALSLSRMLYDIENLISPVLAGLLLSVMSFHWLFAGTAVGFFGSAFLLVITAIPAVASSQRIRPFRERLTRGTRIYLATPRLRGLLSLNLTAAATSAFVIVNTVVLVRAGYGGAERAVAYALAAYGAGSMTVALMLPRLLRIWPDRVVMMTAAGALAILALGNGLFMLVFGLTTWAVFLFLWALYGALYAAVLTPSGRLLRNSARPEDRPALFAAQFALSHGCWLITYPLAGWLGDWFGLATAMLVLSIVALTGVLSAAYFWPNSPSRTLDHSHPDLPPEHPHLREHGGKSRPHSHIYVIDDEHRDWPTRG